MIMNKLIKEFNNKYPQDLAYDWDNVGLLVGDDKKEIKKILLCLDITNDVVEEAINLKADLIVSHHPLIFKPLKKVTNKGLTEKKVYNLIKNDINVFSLHTNLDSAKDGLNDFVLNKMNLNGNKIHEEFTDNKPIRMFKLNNKQSVIEIAEHIKKELGIKNIRLLSYDKNKKIERIAIVTGSGMDFYKEIKNYVDLFITADVKHHEGLDALEENMNIIDFGHHESESFSIELLYKFLEEFNCFDIHKHYTKSIFETI